ncbi:hypothetical protein [Dyadobacter sandarakinus]|uniref:Uncharacterized protein n=1 Tax=Dyadobacter sandarakinus TaxID=2747268 RepID=A0ABX7I8T2_9BACT|nr:hypothetical protein [Dyadobacter sandarakinus]QRR02375.1 hypothetical protein HWI92_16390 [Dyadobacter sandarakinus]
MIKVKKEQLNYFFQKIVDFLPSEIDLSEDSYWLIGSDNWTDFSKDVPADVGSLTDDWHFLSQLINEKRQVASADLDRLSSILRAISQEINPI